MDPSSTLACLPSTVGPAQLRTRMFLQCSWNRICDDSFSFCWDSIPVSIVIGTTSKESPHSSGIIQCFLFFLSMCPRRPGVKIFPRLSRYPGRDLGVHSVVRGIVILGATKEGGGGEASFCDVQHPGSAGGEGNLLKAVHLHFPKLWGILYTCTSRFPVICDLGLFTVYGLVL